MLPPARRSSAFGTSTGLASLGVQPKADPPIARFFVVIYLKKEIAKPAYSAGASGHWPGVFSGAHATARSASLTLRDPYRMSAVLGRPGFAGPIRVMA